MKGRELNLSEKQTKAEAENIYIRQIDYTQDLGGFFMSMDVNTDLKLLGDLIGVKKASDYTQTSSLFHFTEVDNDLDYKKRVKVYNKGVHLMTCYQFKKWLSMGLHKLLNHSVSSDFYIDKLLPTMDLGLSRIE